MKDNRVIESVWYRCTFCKILLEDLEKMKIHMSRHGGQTTLASSPPVNGTNEPDETEDNKTTPPRYSLRNRNRQSDTKPQKLIPSPPSPGEIVLPTTPRKNTRNHTRNKSAPANSKIKRFHCDFCDSMFQRKEQLAQHLRIHTGERPYVCKICKKAFTQLANLNHHLRTHTGERPYTCKWCSKSFAQVTNLMFHERLHTGEKPYECNTCGTKFAQIANYQTHMKKHENSSTYQYAGHKKKEK